MWSEYSLEVVDAVARNGSFSAAAQELHRVPSAVSYTVRQLEEWLAVPLFVRRHRDVELTPAGVWFLKEGRSVIKKMQITRQQCQQIANGWRGQLAIAVDNIVRPERTRQMIVDFYRHFDDVELLVFQEVFNGVWDALSDGRVELAIGATQAIPVGGRYAFRDMGTLSWSCVVASDHPLASMPRPLSDDTLRNWPSLVREDTSRTLPKRITWLLDNQKKGRRTGLGVIGNLPVGRTMRGNGADAFCPTVDRQRKMGGADVRESVSRCGLLRDVAAKRSLARAGMAAGLFGR